ncbi:MAG: hypothetical protein OEW85_15935, partial [Acidimicrobiia bacterium]|nr:hypothetical protein [Acidimicrobiia bacterium]
MLSEAELSDDDAREIAGRDDQAAWYDEVHGTYTDRAEIPPVLAAVGAAAGPVLEVGAGTGRFTAAVARATG